MTHSARATRALQVLAETDPALAALSFWCAHRDDDGAPPGGATLAAWSDATSIHYAARFAALPLAEQVGLCAHHILHVAFRHAGRERAMALREGPDFDPARFALGCDAIVNDTVLAAGYALPRPAVRLSELVPHALGRDGALAEWDCERLYKALSQPPGGRAGGGSGDADRLRAQAGARAAEYGDEAGFEPDIDSQNSPAAGPDETAEDSEWRQRVIRALEEGRRAGVGLGRIGHRIGDLPRSDTAWELLLRGLASRALLHRPRPNARRPAARWLAMDSLARARGRPSPPFAHAMRRMDAAPRIAVGLDCSGSIDAAPLARLGAELSAIARRSGAETHVLVFDEAVRGRWQVPASRAGAGLLTRALPRGGGTDFAPVIAEAAALDPSLIVILSDLDGPMGPDPRLPVLWAVPEGRPPEPPFGRVVSLAR